MKIGWVTPIHHASAIGRSGIGIAEAIAKAGVEVDILRSERDRLLKEQRLPTRLNIHSLAAMRNYAALEAYDLLVYNIGDNADFHLHAVSALMQVPGVCIFHDLLILNLFTGWMAENNRTSGIPSAIDDIYGAGAYSPATPGACYLTRAVNDFPMLEWLAPRALAAVAHGRHYLSRLRESCPGPVRHIPLAYDLPAEIPPPSHRSQGDELRLTTIGHINRNKLCAEVIRAIGATAVLRKRCCYRLAGPISDEMRQDLAGLAERLGVKLHIAGAVSKSGLAREIEDADIMVCLRNPVLEGASASAIEAMLAGRPLVVIDHGFYRDLPDDLTIKLAPDFTIETLSERICWLVDHPDQCRMLGERAATWARDAFSFETYAKSFIELAEKAIESKPLLGLAADLGRELSALGVRPDDPATARIAQMVSALFLPGDTSCQPNRT
ncbi:MAG: glycosyltransferase family 4 protein [Rhodomicrobiaceae bacterium]